MGPWLAAVAVLASACGEPGADDTGQTSVASFNPAEGGTSSGGDASAGPGSSTISGGSSTEATLEGSATVPPDTGVPPGESSSTDGAERGETTATVSASASVSDTSSASTDDGPSESTGPIDPAACIDDDLGGALGDGVASGHIGGEGDEVWIECADDGGDDVVYSWTAPADGTYTFDLSGSDYDTALVILDGACDAMQLGCNDDAIATASELTLDVAGGQSLLVVVDGYDGRTGWFVLDINPGVSDGASCVDGGDLGSSLGAVAMGSTVGASDSLSPECDADGADVIYRWTAPSDGQYTFSTAGSSYDTLLGLRSPDCYGWEFACNDDAADQQAEIVTDLAGGEVVIVIVDGYDGAEGDYVLTIF